MLLAEVVPEPADLAGPADVRFAPAHPLDVRRETVVVGYRYPRGELLRGSDRVKAVLRAEKRRSGPVQQPAELSLLHLSRMLHKAVDLAQAGSGE